MKSASETKVVPTPLATWSSDQPETALVKLLAEAIVADIRRGGAPAGEKPDETDDAPESCAAPDVRTAEEKDGES